jgi:hypothetical protein
MILTSALYNDHVVGTTYLHEPDTHEIILLILRHLFHHRAASKVSQAWLRITEKYLFTRMYTHALSAFMKDTEHGVYCLSNY